MVKLERGTAPAQLSAAFVKAETDEFKANGTSVWNVPWLKDALRAMSHGKCAYCECSVETTSVYMEVEHFINKDSDPDKVLAWDNLLPACKRCNVNKQAHDVLADPIINPTVQDPPTELSMRNYRLDGRTSLGETTIDVLGLNEADRLVKVRFEVGDALNQALEEAMTKKKLYEDNALTVRRNKLTGALRAILRECQPESTFAATCSHVLHTSPQYHALRAFLKAQSLWDSDMEQMDAVSALIAL